MTSLALVYDSEVLYFTSMEKIERLKKELLELPVDRRKHLFKEVEDLSNKPDLAAIASRPHEFDNKLGVCPHFSHPLQSVR